LETYGSSPQCNRILKLSYRPCCTFLEIVIVLLQYRDQRKPQRNASHSVLHESFVVVNLPSYKVNVYRSEPTDRMVGKQLDQ